MTEISFEKAAGLARIELQKAQIVMELNPREALGHLVEARRLDPRDSEIAWVLARLEVRLGRFVEATDSLQRVLALDEFDDEALGLLGFCHFKTAHFGQAEGYARSALRLNKTNTVAREVLADCLRAQKNWSEAIGEYQDILGGPTDLNPGTGARLRLKLAQCLLKAGTHGAAWEMTHALIEEGYGGAQVEAIHCECERLNKHELGKAFKNRGFFERLLLWAAKKQVSQALSMGRRRAGEAPKVNYSNENGASSGDFE